MCVQITVFVQRLKWSNKIFSHFLISNLRNALHFTSLKVVKLDYIHDRNSDIQVKRSLEVCLISKKIWPFMYGAQKMNEQTYNARFWLNHPKLFWCRRRWRTRGLFLALLIPIPFQFVFPSIFIHWCLHVLSFKSTNALLLWRHRVFI